MCSRSSLLALLILSLPVMATDDRRGGDFRPTGPVKINADRAEWQKGGEMVYSGNVKLESGELSLTGDQLTLQQQDNGEFEARVTGGPATLDHSGDPQGPVETREPISARSSELIYRSRSDTVDIVGDASLKRGTDVITGQRVRYDVGKRKVEAAGGVEIVIQPPKQGRDREQLPSLTPDIRDPEHQGS